MATKINETQAQELIDNYPPKKRLENDVFSFWHCQGLLDGYPYYPANASVEDLDDESTLDQANTYFKNKYKEFDYKGVRPTASDNE